MSHLSENDNELWTKKYIAGGLYECCLLQYYATDQNQFQQYFNRFFSVYSQQVTQLFTQLNAGISTNTPFQKNIIEAIQKNGRIQTFYSAYENVIHASTK